MNNIKITHELCAEDRARLDRLADLLDRRITQAALIMTGKYEPEISDPVPDLDACQQKLAEVIAKASDPVEPPKNAVEEAEPSTLTTTPSEEESAPTEEMVAPVTLEAIQQKVMQLAASDGGAKKAKVREIVNAYAKKVSDLPEDKWGEIWDKLIALENEAQR